MHDAILAEQDPVKRSAMYRDAHMADYYFASATAVTQEGDLVRFKLFHGLTCAQTAADLTGTKVGAFNYAAGHIVLVCGTHKIVPTFADAVKRTGECTESHRSRLIAFCR